MTEKGPKSAYELAMERLLKKDAEQGIVERPLTDAQKAEIAEVRNLYEAKIAQAEVMHQSALAKAVDPQAWQEAEENYRRERERLTSERERKVEEIRARE
ncbi:MAG TPA: hypothetical protein VK886_21865 [Vicinamibacterales bacterium]|nr:hypothetical protein [Vicinamibacterales bacterium]